MNSSRTSLRRRWSVSRNAINGTKRGIHPIERSSGSAGSSSPLESDACLGFIQATIHTSATADFAFVPGPAYWGRGLAHEAVSSALQTLFADYAISSLFAMADERNVRSISLLTRLGFQRVERVNQPHRAVLPSDHLFQLNRRLNTP